MHSVLVAIVFCVALPFFRLAALEDHARNKDSEIVRQWIVCQYVNAGVASYALAKEALIDQYGVGNPKRTRVFWTPMESGVPVPAELGDRYGPPEATYSPSAIGMLAVTIGLLKDRATVLWVWFGANVVATLAVALGLTRLWRVPPGRLTSADNFPLVVLALILFLPVYITFWCGQFSIMLLGLVLLMNSSSVSPWVRGIALGIALGDGRI